jgi:hypothetical protein
VKHVVILSLVLVTAMPVSAHVWYESWEGSSSVLGMYGTGEPPLFAEPVSGSSIGAVDGTQVLWLMDNSPDGAPQAFVAWVQSLEAGDSVAASIWRYDDTPDAVPSCLLWANWNDDPVDINVYDGTAGGDLDYGSTVGWGQLTGSWVVPTEHTGLVIQVRLHSRCGDELWVDALTVSVPDHAWVMLPTFTSDAEPRSWSAIKWLYR